MCGIVGVAPFNNPEKWIQPMERALRSLSHRGPDDSGMDVAETLILGHTRLSIIDLSSAAHQPMRHGHLRIVFNGEIYNYRELRAELARAGMHFATDSDTEVLLQAWSYWGAASLRRLVGMWAFALHDEKAGQLVLSRDPFGIKPLYYTWIDSCLAFASEIPALLALGRSARANMDRVLDYIITGAVDHTPETFFSGVVQVPGGHNMVVDLRGGAARLHEYHVIPEELRAGTVEELDERVKHSVSLHMRSDVPVGTCLSGGVDSSIVAALASRNHMLQGGSAPFVAITAQSADPRTDETEYARLVVDHCGLDWRITRPTYADFAREIDVCLNRQGEPVGGASVFMQYSVMKTAKESGLKVLLDGQGGDEIGLGYERHYIAYFLHLLKRRKLGDLTREFRAAARNSRLTIGALAAYAVYFGCPSIRQMRSRRRMWFLDSTIRRRADETIERMSQGFFDVSRLQRAEIQKYSLPHLLRYEDRNSMGVSIEARVPFVQSSVVECALSMRPEDKIKGGFTKYALRRIADDLLPHEIAWRRSKIGFEAPAVSWMQEHRGVAVAAAQTSSILKIIAPRGIPYDRLGLDLQWRVYNLAQWESAFSIAI